MSLALLEASEKLVAWFRSQTLPLLLKQSIDLAHGGAYERLLADGSPDLSANRRLRTQAQLASLFCLAEQQGWSTKVAANVRGLHAFAGRHGALPCRSDGYVRTLSAELDIVDPDYDLTDHAYFILSSSCAYGVYGSASDLRRAINIVDWLDLRLKHEEGGWGEGTYPARYRKTRSHLVLFDVFTYLFSLSGKSAWRQKSLDIYTLFSTRFYDAGSGSVWSCADDDWSRPSDVARSWLDSGAVAHWALLIQRHLKQMGEKSDLPLHMLKCALSLAQTKNAVLIPESVGDDLVADATEYHVGSLCNLIAACVSLMEDYPGTEGEWLGSIAVESINRFFSDFVVLEHPGLCVPILDAQLKPTQNSCNTASLYDVAQACVAVSLWSRNASL